MPTPTPRPTPTPSPTPGPKKKLDLKCFRADGDSVSDVGPVSVWWGNDGGAGEKSNATWACNEWNERCSDKTCLADERAPAKTAFPTPKPTPKPTSPPTPPDVLKHAPVFVFHRKEKYWPCSTADYVRNCRVVTTKEPAKVVLGSPEPADLPRLRTKPGEHSLVLKDADPARKHGRRMRERPDGTLEAVPNERYSEVPEAYWIRQTLRYVADDPAVPAYEAVDITYALWFAYNGTRAAHQADREYVVVRLRGGTPVGVYFSNHTGGYWKRWDQLTREGSGLDRPVVYVARESHAMYHAPGIHRRVLGFGNDHADAGGVRVGAGRDAWLPLVSNTDPTKPWLLWKGQRSLDDNGGFLHIVTPDKGCAVTDMPALAASKLSPAARTALVVGLSLAVLGLGFLSATARRAWIRVPAVVMACACSGGLGIAWLVFTANVAPASLESVWWWL